MTPEQAMMAIHYISSREEIPTDDWHKSLLPLAIQAKIDSFFTLVQNFCKKYQSEIREAYETDRRLTEEARLARLNAVQDERTQLDIEKLEAELEELREWKKTNIHEKSAFETQVM